MNLTRYLYNLGSTGEVSYAKLIREEILACDKELIKHAKKANAIGGKLFWKTMTFAYQKALIIKIYFT